MAVRGSGRVLELEETVADFAETDFDYLDDDVSQSMRRRSARKRRTRSNAAVATPSQHQHQDGEHSGPPKVVLLGLKAIIGIIFFIVFLGSSVFSRITLLSLTDELRNMTMNGTFYHKNRNLTNEEKSEAVTVYWQLLIILLVPNLITLLRCLFFGFLGKTTTNFPWPNKLAVLASMLGAALEVVGMCLLVYVVLATLPAPVSALLLHTVFFFQIAIDIWKTYSTRKCMPRKFGNYNVIRHTERKHYDDLEGGADKADDTKSLLDSFEEMKKASKTERLYKLLNMAEYLLENWIAKVLAFLLQGIGLAAFLIFWAMKLHSENDRFYMSSLIILPLVLLCMSGMWTSKFQNWIAKPKIRDGSKPAHKRSARYKSSLISSSVRLFLYPLVSYVVFRYATPFDQRIDPWCLSGDCTISISSSIRDTTVPHISTRDTMIVHIVTSFVAYLVAWVSCTMTLSQFSLGIPLVLSTPVTLVYYWTTMESNKNWLHFFYYSDESTYSGYMWPAFAIGWVIWLGAILAMGFFICTKTNIILARDEDMFLTPHYDSVFLDQHIVLNRQVKRFKQGLDHSITKVRERKPRMIFICSTMYRENATEMKQMLASISRVSKQCAREHQRNCNNCDRFESHIFFDGAITGNQIENFGLQLLSLLKESLDIDMKNGKKTETPYGYTLSWMIGDVLHKVMPFTIHFKDRNKVKPKKRWSQVMYMNYVLNHKIRNSNGELDPDNTFILTTDADIDFTADSAIVLLDMMDTNENIAAVSARTHPKGYGPVYWYQLFDYAIGHWFQKPAEHILGSVLCSPGCFSVFRCSALALVVEEYATEVSNATEFLMKDMGEDRWLCTLLIKKGLRLEYCAISEDYTYCPTDFDEFYKQRRRWIPSTVANLFMLVSESNLITRGNDSISILYIFFQAVMIFSTSIAPATVVMVIAAGLQPFGMPILISVVLFFSVGVVYGFICLYASPKAQLDVAKLLTFIFTIIMALVVIGIIKDIIESLTSSPSQKFIGPPDCSDFNQSFSDYDQCMKGLAYASHSNSTRIHYFMMPVSFTVMYIAALAGTFFLAGIFHLNEITCLFHSIWFLLAMPSGYLLLLIYSAANLCDRSWGTREQSSGEDQGIWGWTKYLVQFWHILSQSRCSLWCYGNNNGSGSKGGGGGGSGKDGNEGKGESKDSGGKGGGGNGGDKDGRGGGNGGDKDEKDGGDKNGGGGSGSGEDGKRRKEGESGTASKVMVAHRDLDPGVSDWLADEDRECGMYLSKFKDHGYTSFHFLAEMTHEDLKAIGVEKEGYQYRLLREIKKLPKISADRYYSGERGVGDWLHGLEMEEYREMFQSEGYRTWEDMRALSLLDHDKLKAMGVAKRAHLQRLTKATKYLSTPAVAEAEMDEDAQKWLRDLECEEYEDGFTKHGYTTKHFLSGIKDKELQAVGVEKKGLRLRLQKAAQKLPSLRIDTDVPKSVEAWLESLELEEYTCVFHSEGYKSAEDMEHLKELTVDQLKAMGIQKTAHLKRLETALDYLVKPSPVELRKRNTKSTIDSLMSVSLKVRDRDEHDFWRELIETKLKPVAQKFTQVKDVQKSLVSLRNLVLAVLLLMNLMWIVLLFSLSFWQLQKYAIDPRAFQLMFLFVYGLIIIIQFFTMIAHRAVTLIHYLGRVTPREVLVVPWAEEFQVVDLDDLGMTLGKSGMAESVQLDSK